MKHAESIAFLTEEIKGHRNPNHYTDAIMFTLRLLREDSLKYEAIPEPPHPLDGLAEAYDAWRAKQDATQKPLQAADEKYAAIGAKARQQGMTQATDNSFRAATGRPAGQCTEENCQLCAGAAGYEKEYPVSPDAFPEPSKDLTFPEAMQALLDGKKVRVDAWGEGEWIRRSSKRGFEDENGDGVDIVGTPDRIFGKWRIVEDAPAAEPEKTSGLTPREAMAALLDGKKVRSENWTKGAHVTFTPEGTFVNQHGTLDSFWMGEKASYAIVP